MTEPDDTPDTTAPDTPTAPRPLMPEPSTEADWLVWRAQREEELREPNGWLSLTSLTWLDAAPQAVPGFPGLWSARGSALPSADGEDWQAQVLLPEDAGVAQDGAPVTGTVTLRLATGDSDRSLMCGDVQAEVAQRGGAVMVRIRNPLAPTRAAFHGVPAYGFSPEWIRPARFTPDPAPHEFTVPSAHPGLTTRLTALGRVQVSLPDGSTVDLQVTGSPESPSVIFHDPTNGGETSGWRAAPVALPGSSVLADEDGPAGPGRVPPITSAPSTTAGAQPVDGAWDALVDFNRSTNFPAHFTAYGTCPTPPPGNDVPIAVTAGERRPSPAAG